MKLFYFTLLLLIPSFLFGGGGWVGNSRMQIAFNQIGSGQLHPRTDSDDELRPQNYFLLSKGEMRLWLGGLWAPETKNDVTTTKESVVFSFDYGLTENLTWSDLVSFEYRLLANNGSGHEIAIGFGPMRSGLGHIETRGLYITPGFDLAHTWAKDGFRITNSIGAYAVLAEHANRAGENLRFGNATHFVSISQDFGTNWNLWISSGTEIGYKSSVDNGVEVNRVGYTIGGFRPQVGIARRIGNHAELSFSTSVDKITTFNDPISLLKLSVRW